MPRVPHSTPRSAFHPAFRIPPRVPHSTPRSAFHPAFRIPPRIPPAAIHHHRNGAGRAAMPDLSGFADPGSPGLGRLHGDGHYLTTLTDATTGSRRARHVTQGRRT
jgi:hypothetical protein